MLPAGKMLYVHEKVATDVVLESPILVVPPEHRVCEEGDATTIGRGFTVTGIAIGTPLQPFAVGVTA